MVVLTVREWLLIVPLLVIGTLTTLQQQPTAYNLLWSA